MDPEELVHPVRAGVASEDGTPAVTSELARHVPVGDERAKMAGCRTLGVVMYGANDRMPAWIRRFVNHEQTLLGTRGE